MSSFEQKRIVKALHFELGKVDSKEVRVRMVNEILNNISHELAAKTAEGIGVDPPVNKMVGKVQDKVGNAKDAVVNTVTPGKGTTESKALSIDRNNKADTIKSRQVAILIDKGFHHQEVMVLKQALKDQGAQAKIVSMFKGMIKSADGQEVEVDKSHITTGSIMFDAIFLPGGQASAEAMKKQGDVLHFINEAFKHGKPIGAINEGIDVLLESSIKGATVATTDQQGQVVSEDGVVTCRLQGDHSEFTKAFIQAIAQHRHWGREEKMMVPA
jgi:catalase